MLGEPLIAFEPVEALEDDGRALRVRVQGCEVWVPHEHMAITDRVVIRPGDRGVLVLPESVATALGLLPGS
jgi:hypothetical protein